MKILCPNCRAAIVFKGDEKYLICQHCRIKIKIPTKKDSSNITPNLIEKCSVCEKVIKSSKNKRRCPVCGQKVCSSCWNYSRLVCKKCLEEGITSKPLYTLKEKNSRPKLFLREEFLEDIKEGEIASIPIKVKNLGDDDALNVKVEIRSSPNIKTIESADIGKIEREKEKKCILRFTPKYSGRGTIEILLTYEDYGKNKFFESIKSEFDIKEKKKKEEKNWDYQKWKYDEKREKKHDEPIKKESESLEALLKQFGCAPDASIEDIKKRKKVLNMMYHPDFNVNKPDQVKKEMEDMLKEINQVYQKILIKKGEK
ncbi:MAG: DnaJ domain protein [Candidatus Methanofastidiosum methylothiophilum]|uniref:DnaJ domain protein n=1 Tax=Candidatus Methanofastidiosum methylothiophilum TaxID=1705564 RepID=A0A150J7T0_9EURY|nr:MAG: DnaJ domain protein [Candidatus Methanofastidiosum methylthiophilus]